MLDSGRASSSLTQGVPSGLVSSGTLSSSQCASTTLPVLMQPQQSFEKSSGSVTVETVLVLTGTFEVPSVDATVGQGLSRLTTQPEPT